MLTEAISSGELDPELTILHDAIAQRRHTLRAIQIAAACELQPGDRVKLNRTTRPLYLHGARGARTSSLAMCRTCRCSSPPRSPARRSGPCRGAGLEVPIWILGSSTFGARIAALLGLPYAFASHLHRPT